MSKEREEALRQLKRSEEATSDAFDSWVEDLEEAEQPETCSIDDEDCEACGS